MPPELRLEEDASIPRKKRTKAPRYERRRQEIIDAAADVFRRRGYSDASVQEIADAVGLLKGSLYHYIDSKEDLLFAVLTQTYELARANIDTVEALSELGPLEKLREYVKLHVQFIADHTTKIAIYYHDFELVGPDRRPLLVEQRKQIERYVSDLIARAQAIGEVDPRLDARVCSYLVLGAMNWAYTWFRPDGRVSADELGELTASLALDGLRRAGRA
jgi:AcrR family transcriptional regulator